MAFHRLRDWSIFVRWGWSLVLSLLPLILAVTYAIWTIDNQSRLQYQLNQQTLALSNNSVTLKEQLSNLERTIRQYVLLREPDLEKLYHTKLKGFLATEKDFLDNALLESSSREHWQGVLDTINSRLEVLMSAQQTEFAKNQKMNLEASYHDLKILELEVDDIIHNKLKKSELLLKNAEIKLVLLGVLIIPVSIVLVLFSVKAVVRPIHALSRTIEQLGRGYWKGEINIEGPIDLVILGKRLEWMRQKLDSNEHHKQKFLRNVTHELKTPLAAIMEAASLLSDRIPGPINPSQDQILQILSQNAMTLKNLIQQLLNYNSASIQYPVNYQAVELQTFVNQMVGEFVVNSDNIFWELEDKPCLVKTDPDRLELILRNLLSNAINYSCDEKKIAIHWRQSKTNWYLCVSDNGLGIAQAEQVKIFEPFYKVNQYSERIIKGSGIGLAIVKECVDTMHGSISVMSELGKGSQFELAFPIKMSQCIDG